MIPYSSYNTLAETNAIIHGRPCTEIAEKAREIIRGKPGLEIVLTTLKDGERFVDARADSVLDIFNLCLNEGARVQVMAKGHYSSEELREAVDAVKKELEYPWERKYSMSAD